MKKSLHSSPHSTPAPLAFLSARSAGTSPSPTRGQQLSLIVAKIQCSPPQTTLAFTQERCHRLRARQLRCSHIFPGRTERHWLRVPGYNYKDGNNLPGQPHQSHHQKALSVPKPSRAQAVRRSSGVDEFLRKRWQPGRGQPGMLSSRAWSTPIPSTHMGICHLLLRKKTL